MALVPWRTDTLEFPESRRRYELYCVDCGLMYGDVYYACIVFYCMEMYWIVLYCMYESNMSRRE